MARVTIIFKDVTSGPHDGGVTMAVECDPPLTAGPNPSEFTPCQEQAFTAIGFINANFETLGTPTHGRRV